MDPIKVFFSYSHRDEKLRDELSFHLSSLKRKNIISEWHDRKITAGNEWAKAIDDNLETSQIILLLISQYFLASDYCYDLEMKAAMKKHEAGQAIVVPVILRPCDWMETPFSKLQVVPRDGKPITSWDNQDEAWLDVEQKLLLLCKELRGDGLQRQNAGQWEENDHKALRDYIEIETRRNSTIRFPLLNQQGELFSLPMGAIRMDIPLYLTHEHHLEKKQSILDFEMYNDVYRESFTSNYLFDRASHNESFIGGNSDIRKIHDLLSLETRLIIVGDPGCGKTTLLSKVAYHYSQKYLLTYPLEEAGISELAAQDDPYPNQSWIPITIFCRDLLDFIPGDDMESLISHQIRKLGYDKKQSENLGRLLAGKVVSGEAILLIDGLDEIPDEKKRQEFAAFLSKKANITKTPMILTSRIVGFHAVKEIVSDNFDFVYVAPLGQRDKMRFIQDWSRWASKEPEALINELTPLVCHSRKIAKLCETMFLLVLVAQMRMSYGDIPNQRKDIYRRAIELMIGRHQKLQGNESLNINEVWPYLEYLAYRMRVSGAQKWTEAQVLETLDELRSLETNEPDMHRHPSKVWLDNVIHGTGILNVAGSSVDEKGFERPVIQFFHQSFQEYFAAQALQHGRGSSRDHDVIQSIKQQLDSVVITERRIEQVGSGQRTEPVAAGQWQEVIRLLIAELKDADGAIRILLPSEDAKPQDTRALTIFALQCLAEEPNITDETALMVFNKVSNVLNELDGINTTKNTIMDEAIYSITRSAFGDMFRQRLLQIYIHTNDPVQRRRIGCTLASSWGIQTFEGREFSEIQEIATRIIPDLEQAIKSGLLIEKVDAALKMIDIYYWLHYKNGKTKSDILPQEIVQKSLNPLFDILQTHQHETLLTTTVWVLTWLTNARTEHPLSFPGFSEQQRDLLEKILLDGSMDFHARADAAILLCLHPSELVVFGQNDWIYEWAVVADGNKAQQNLPGYKQLPYEQDAARLRSVLTSDAPTHLKIWAALAMGRLGYFENSMIDPLFELFLNEVKTGDERDEALVYLVFVGGEKVARKLVEIARQKVDESDKYAARERALLALLGLGDITALREQLNFGNDDVMNLNAYAFALAGVKPSMGRDALHELLDHPDRMVRESAKKALAKATEWGYIA